jgi:hypothetical protein
MKLKVPKLDWKQKVDKLRKIVLSGPAIEELPPGMLAMLEAWRAHTHGELTDDRAGRGTRGTRDAGRGTRDSVRACA